MMLDIPTRREFVATITTGVVAGLAGCEGEQGDTSGENETPTDQQNETPTEQVIYAFAPDRIAIIEPESAEVVAQITADFQEVDWGDILPSPDN